MQCMPPRLAQTVPSSCNVFLSPCGSNRTLVIIQPSSATSLRCSTLPQTEYPTSSTGLFFNFDLLFVLSHCLKCIFLYIYLLGATPSAFKAGLMSCLLLISSALFIVLDTEEVLSKDILNVWVKSKWLNFCHVTDLVTTKNLECGESHSS